MLLDFIEKAIHVETNEIKTSLVNTVAVSGFYLG